MFGHAGCRSPVSVNQTGSSNFQKLLGKVALVLEHTFSFVLSTHARRIEQPVVSPVSNFIIWAFLDCMFNAVLLFWHAFKRSVSALWSLFSSIVYPRASKSRWALCSFSSLNSFWLPSLSFLLADLLTIAHNFFMNFPARNLNSFWLPNFSRLSLVQVASSITCMMRVLNFATSCLMLRSLCLNTCCAEFPRT